jgi:3-deoxy-7-phosphoheptulonate synthase
VIVVMRTGADRSEIEAVKQAIRGAGLEPYPVIGEERTVIAVVGSDDERARPLVIGLPGVEQVMAVSKPYKLTSREHHQDRTVVRVGGIGSNVVAIGAGSPLVVMAGPCAVEGREQILATARWVKREGATMLRGGAFKPRSSPYSFQGLGEEGLKLLAEAREETGLPIVSEITDPADVPMFEPYVDMLQIGARNMANFVLLTACGKSSKPVLLKRGLSSTIEELLMAAEYILSAGNPNVVLVERGIRTYEKATRNTLDLNAVPVLKDLTHLPVVVDPSHGTGHRHLVRPMAVAGVAAGADGLIIEVHPEPPKAWSDSEQSLSFPEFGDLMDDLRRFEYLRNPTSPTNRPTTAPPAELDRLRARIDDVDSRLAALLEERAELSVAVQQTRRPDDHGHDVSRERALLERAASTEGGILTREEREMVFSAMLRALRSAQRREAAREAAAQGSPSPAGTSA